MENKHLSWFLQLWKKVLQNDQFLWFLLIIGMCLNKMNIYSIVNILLYKKLFYINIFHPPLDPSTFFTLHCKAAHKQCVFISVSI